MNAERIIQLMSALGIEPCYYQNITKKRKTYDYLIIHGASKGYHMINKCDLQTGWGKSSLEKRFIVCTTIKEIKEIVNKKVVKLCNIKDYSQLIKENDNA